MTTTCQVFLAEERSGTFKYDAGSEVAIKVEDADFQWEGAPPDTAPKSKKEQAVLAAKLKAEKKTRKHDDKVAQKALKAGAPLDPAGGDTKDEKFVADGDPTTSPIEAEETLQLSGVNLAIPRGQLCAIVGSVGCAFSL